jgi:hypothetical protein
MFPFKCYEYFIEKCSKHNIYNSREKTIVCSLVGTCGLSRLPPTRRDYLDFERIIVRNIFLIRLL